MVKLANFIVGWFKLFPITLFCLSYFYIYWDPLFYILIGSSFVCSLIYILTNKWATKLAKTSTPFMDYFWELFDRAQKILEEYNNTI